MREQQPTPVANDANATAEQLLDRAAQDLSAAVAARIQRQTQGCTEVREGVLHGESNRR